jgi:Protein of unknown function (DUF1501)
MSNSHQTTPDRDHSPTPHRHVSGMVRREFLQVGFSGFLGASLSGLLAARSRGAVTSGAGNAKSVLLVFLTGAPSHIDTFDPKPSAAEGIRSLFRPIPTSVPGISFTEQLPGLAARADKLAVVRSMSHSNLNHLNATHHLLTGHPQPNAIFDKIASRGDYPCYASGLDALRPRSDGVPSGVMLPTFLMEGPLIWPGQHAGFLGPRHDPWQIKRDPNSPNFREDSLTLPAGFTVERLSGRRKLLDEMSATRDSLSAATSRDPMADQRDSAYSLLLNSRVARAFDLKSEDPKLRDKYGRHMFGQSLLLSRRLIEAGVPIVQANMGGVQTWDSHSDIFRRLKDDLLPPTDRAISALLDDLQGRGMLDETLVVITGEFGRAPRLTKNGGNPIVGRDHWASVFTSVFAGAGVRGGQTIGQSDKVGGFPNSVAYTPNDLAATVYSALGVDLESEVRDKLNRPSRLCTGTRIEPLYSGASA